MLGKLSCGTNLNDNRDWQSMQKQTEKLPLHSRTFSQHHVCTYVDKTLTSIYSPLMPSSFTHWLVTSLHLRTYVCITDTLNKYTHFSSICRSVVKNSSTNTAQRKNEKQTNCCVCRKKHRLSHTEALHMQALDNCTPSSTYSMASIHLSDHRTTTIVLVLCYILLEPLSKDSLVRGYISDEDRTCCPNYTEHKLVLKCTEGHHCTKNSLCDMWGSTTSLRMGRRLMIKI